MICETEKKFITCSNLRKLGKQDHALNILNDIDIKDLNYEHLAFYYYFKGRLLKETFNNEKALDNFKLCIDLKNSVKDEKYTIPHSLMECGDVYIRLNNTEEAIHYLTEAKKYKNYDFDKPNIRRIMRLLDQAQNRTDETIPFSANE